jgi:Spy/CpxP family protein refolding chaperone
MKTIILAASALLAITTASISPAFARGHGGGHHGSSSHSSGITHVRSYTRRDGTYVEHHDRTHETKTQMDNWSTKGNVNPETGKAGTVEPTH